MAAQDDIGPSLELVGNGSVDEDGRIELTFHPGDLLRNSLGSTFSLRLGLGVRSIPHHFEGKEYVIEFKHLFLRLHTKGVALVPGTCFVDPPLPLSIKQRTETSQQSVKENKGAAKANAALDLTAAGPPSGQLSIGGSGEMSSGSKYSESKAIEIEGIQPVVEYTSGGWDIGDKNRGDPRRGGILWARYFERGDEPLCQFRFQRNSRKGILDFELRAEAFVVRPHGVPDAGASRHKWRLHRHSETASHAEEEVRYRWRQWLASHALAKQMSERTGEHSNNSQPKPVLAIASIVARLTPELEETPLPSSGVGGHVADDRRQAGSGTTK